MKIGLNMVPVTADKLLESSRLAEELGFESLWIGEHIVLPMVLSKPYPYGQAVFQPRTEFLDPFSALAHVAAATHTVRLGTGIVILPARSFFTAARAIVSVDVLSGGRLDLGVGTGWCEDEFELCGEDFHTRGERMDEQLDALEALWQQDTPSFKGKHLNFENIAFEPKPAQSPRVPVHIGGFAPAALRRAARRGDGWYGSATSPDEARERIVTIDRMLREYGRDPARFEYTVMVWAPPDAATVRAYEAAGAHRIIATPFDVKTREIDAMGKIKDFATLCGLR